MITYNTMQKPVIQSRVEGATISHLDKLHEGIQHRLLDFFIGLRRGENIDERLKELVELGTQPGEVDELRRVVGVGGGGGGGRELRELREEEGVEGDERFDEVARW